MLTSLIRSATSQPSSYPIVLTRLGESLSRLNPHLKLWKCQKSNPQPKYTITSKKMYERNKGQPLQVL